MKKRVVALLAIVGLALSACGGGGGGSKYEANNDSPENVVYMLLKSFANEDAELFCKAIDPSMVDMMEQTGTKCADMAKDEIIPEASKDFTDEDREKIDTEYEPKVEMDGDDAATVTVKSFGEKKEKEHQSMPVLKVDGKWYIDLMNME